MLRNLGGPQELGPRASYERLLKLGYGLSILGTVPLVVIPFQDMLLPPLAAWAQAQRWAPAEWRQACSQRGGLGEQLIAAGATCEPGAVVGRGACLLGTHCRSAPLLAAVWPAGTALAAAIYLPNVEFIFGLAGSTASVLVAYIMPAGLFLLVTRMPVDVLKGLLHCAAQPEAHTAPGWAGCCLRCPGRPGLPLLQAQAAHPGHLCAARPGPCSSLG